MTDRRVNQILFMFLAQNPEQGRILIVESSGLSPRLDKTRRAILRQQEDHVRLKRVSDYVA